MNSTFSASTSIIIEAPVNKVWEALTNPEIIKQYLHGTNTKTDWVVGHPITWSGEWNGKPYEDKGEVLAFESNKIVKTSHWSPLAGQEDKPENYHIVTYELSSDNNKTRLTLTQGDNSSQEDVESMVENGWKPILLQIKELLEMKYG